MNAHETHLLHQIQLFAHLNPEDIGDVAERVNLQEFRKGQVILHEEDTNEYMYVVLRGEVKVYHTTRDGKEAIVALHGKGDSFGEIPLIDQKATPATVAALEDSLLAIIARRDFFDLLQNHPQVLHNLLLALTERLRSSWKQIRMLHFNDATHRIKALLQGLVDKWGDTTPDGVLLNLRLTHQSIADMTGLTRETVTRVIDRWKCDGLLGMDEHRHVLIRPNFFENISEL